MGKKPLFSLAPATVLGRRTWKSCLWLVSTPSLPIALEPTPISFCPQRSTETVLVAKFTGQFLVLNYFWMISSIWHNWSIWVFISMTAFTFRTSSEYTQPTVYIFKSTAAVSNTLANHVCWFVTFTRALKYIYIFEFRCQKAKATYKSKTYFNEISCKVPLTLFWLKQDTLIRLPVNAQEDRKEEKRQTGNVV